MKITIEKRVQLNGTGFSALEYHEGNLIAIADNSEGIFVFNREGELLEKLGDTSVLAKKEKPDFEAASFVVWNEIPYFMRTASGSTENRMKCSLLEWQTKQETVFSLQNFFHFYQKTVNLNLAEINIEALVFQEDNLLFFNRSNNEMIRVSMEDFMQCLQDASFEPKMEVTKLVLGELNGCFLGISGACTFGKTIYFTASAERTSNWYDDGEVAGSVIGSFSLDDTNQVIDFKYSIIQLENEIIPTKLEGITTDGHSFYAIADNDDKPAEFFRISIGQ